MSLGLARSCSRMCLGLALGLWTQSTELPAAGPDTVRIGVLGLFRPVEFVLRPAQGDRLLLHADGQTITLEGSQRATLRSTPHGVLCQTDRQETIARRMSMVENANGFWLAIPGKLERRFKGRLVVTHRGNTLGAVIHMDIETAVASIVAAESMPDAEPEALKAQAVVTRSFLGAAKRAHDGFDFCDTTHCQFLRSPPSPANASLQAAAATEGIVLAYQGATVAALFSRSCGGTTRSLGEIGLEADRYPFYAVDCVPCRPQPETWHRRLPLRQVQRIFTEGAREPVRIEIARRWGWQTIPSNSYTARREDDWVTVSGAGIGHGAGLCQMGAARLAASGWDFQTILRHYFPSTTLQSDPLTARLRLGRRTR